MLPEPSHKVWLWAQFPELIKNSICLFLAHGCVTIYRKDETKTQKYAYVDSLSSER
jgi:hypothetical protein